jgi:hypothetical protein
MEIDEVRPVHEQLFHPDRSTWLEEHLAAANARRIGRVGHLQTTSAYLRGFETRPKMPRCAGQVKWGAEAARSASRA